jgi:hypothetical protein
MPASGQISMSNLQQVFGGTFPIGMDEYYSNAASGFTTGVSGIPAIGNLINLSMFYGKSKVVMPPVTSGLIGYYTGDSWTGTQWQDVSGSGNHVTSVSGTISNTTTINGIKSLSGTTTSVLTFPAILNSTYTFIHVTRHSGATRRRIFTSLNTGTNWLSGHWGNAVGSMSGVSFQSAWISNIHYNWHNTEWVLSTDQPGLYRSQGVQRSFRAAGSPANPTTFGINVYSTETSDWGCAVAIAYNRQLSAAEINSVESWLVTRFNLTSSVVRSPIMGPFNNNSFSVGSGPTNVNYGGRTFQIGPLPTARVITSFYIRPNVSTWASTTPVRFWVWASSTNGGANTGWTLIFSQWNDGANISSLINIGGAALISWSPAGIYLAHNGNTYAQSSYGNGQPFNEGAGGWGTAHTYYRISVEQVNGGTGGSSASIADFGLRFA